uniref:RRM domain-containing protein n=1 Tax=Setaria digitata TaxID=48799 RepID=A0A915PZU0_9BILA
MKEKRAWRVLNEDESKENIAIHSRGNSVKCSNYSAPQHLSASYSAMQLVLSFHTVPPRSCRINRTGEGYFPREDVSQCFSTPSKSHRFVSSLVEIGTFTTLLSKCPSGVGKIDRSSCCELANTPISRLVARLRMCAAAVASIYDVHQLVDFYRLAYKAGYGFGEATSGAYPLVSGVPPAGVFGGSPTLKARDVSFDTSSKEPHLVRARVFVGNMNTNVITRDDIIRLFSAYGTLLGVTVFKGYAFIQYGTSTEADLAVSALNGYSWNGSILGRCSSASFNVFTINRKGRFEISIIFYLRLFMKFSGSVKVSLCSQVFVFTFTGSREASKFSCWVKRGAENFSGSSANAKKERLDDYGKTAAQNNRNRQTATTDSTESRNLYETGMPDTLICGGCRFVTSDFEEFREHRKSACPTNSVDGEVENEEMKWQCSMCDEVCASGGALIDHAFDRHNIRLLKSGTE